MSKSGRTWWTSAAPLAVITLGMPAWWLLGLGEFLPVLVAVGMAWSLLHRDGPVRLPAGSAWWLLFLVWVVLGVGVLWSDAPGAVPGGDGAGRLLVYGFRVAWYVACTIVLLWVANSSRARMPDRQVYGLVAFLFVLATAGGVVGLVAPELEFRSALETVLPAGLRSNDFVQSMVHVEVADVQYVLGHPSPRPKAPFAFTNTWGSVVALASVFLVAFAVRSSRRWRLAAAAVGAVAMVPIAYSLNRGLWTCLAVGAVGLVVLLTIRSRPERVVLMLAATGVVAVALLMSPLADLVGERLENPHSNDRRGQLVDATVDSVTTGSPVVGFGTTRDVRGNFGTIAGGATPDCPACGVPPLGTQGQVWLVLFSQGWIGLALFLAFLLTAVWQARRLRTLNETIAVFVVGFFLIQIAVYDTLGLPLLMVMVAIGLVAREQRDRSDPDRTPGWTVAQLRARVRAGLPAALVLALVGAGLGWFLTPGRDQPAYVSRARIALTPPPVHLTLPLSVPGAGDATDADPITIDTEAALLSSDSTLERALDRRGTEVANDTVELRKTLDVSAEASTQVLVLTATAPQRDLARTRADVVAHAYLTARSTHLERRREELLRALRRERAQVRGTPGAPDVVSEIDTAVETLLRVRPAVGRVVQLTPAERREPDVAVAMLSGAGLGLLLAVGIAALRRRLG